LFRHLHGIVVSLASIEVDGRPVDVRRTFSVPIGPLGAPVAAAHFTATFTTLHVRLYSSTREGWSQHDPMRHQ
jgi:hypothetical protein